MAGRALEVLIQDFEQKNPQKPKRTFFFFKYLFLYTYSAVLGLSCSMQDLVF